MFNIFHVTLIRDYANFISVEMVYLIISNTAIIKLNRYFVIKVGHSNDLIAKNHVN